MSNERWERAVIKFCHGFSVQDAWEIERFGYKKARLSSKLRLLKVNDSFFDSILVYFYQYFFFVNYILNIFVLQELFELQFDSNTKFKAEVNKISAVDLRSQPLGKDKQGHAYWFQNDDNCQIRVYKEDPDEETWTLVAK